MVPQKGILYENKSPGHQGGVYINGKQNLKRVVT
jgi:hypothetical protein